MKGLEFRNKKFKLYDFILLALKMAPFRVSARIFMSALTSLMPMALTLLTAAFVDSAINIFTEGAPQSGIYIPLLGLILLSAYQCSRMTVIDFLHESISLQLTEVIKPKIVEKRARLEYRLIEDNDSWDLVTRVNKDPAARFADGQGNLLYAAEMILQVISVLIMLISQVWWSGLIFIAVVPSLVYLAVRGGKRIYRAFQSAEKHTRRATYLKTVLMGRDTAEERSLFSYTPGVIKMWYEKFETARKILIKERMRYFISVKLTGVAMTVAIIIIAIVLTFPLSAGCISTGMFIGLITALMSISGTLSWGFTYVTEALTENGEFLKDLTEFFSLPEQEGALDLPEYKTDFESLQFIGVSFKYPGTERYVLKDFSLSLDAGSHYAFVGVNGAGKTTITKLLTGMYDNYEGEILINGKSLRDYPHGELKGLFSIVYQDFARYNISVKENIVIGKAADLDGACDETQLQWIHDAIGLDEVVSNLPNGYDTNIGKIRPDAIDISGGGWQKVAIARALYSPAQVRILDEPTAALDPVAESEIYSTFGKISAGKTTIFITHRLGAAKLASRIIVIDDGHVAEDGSHDQLIALGGIYAEMFANQRSWYDE